MTNRDDSSPRPPLTTDRVLRAAVDLADRDGLSALTMRRLGAELGVEAMSLYKHVANKEAILDGVVELIVGQIEIPQEAFLAVLNLLAAAGHTQPVLLVVDDVHWLDRVSAQVLAAVGRRLTHPRVRIVAGLRTSY